MKYLLDRKQILLLKEAAVDWNKSALGILTGAVISPLSWLAGSIKTGVKKSQLNALAMQWGLEYVKALRALDENKEVQQTSGADEIDNTPDETPEAKQDNSGDSGITIENKDKTVESLKKEQSYFNSLSTIVKGMTSWTNSANAKGFDNAKNSLNNVPEINDSVILDFIPKLDAKHSKTQLNIDSVVEFVNAIKNKDLNGFMNTYKINTPKTAEERTKLFKDKVSDIIANFTGINAAYDAAIEYVSGFKPEAVAKPNTELVVGNEYFHTDAKGNKSVVTLISLDYNLKAGDDKTFLTDDDIQGEPLSKDLAYVAVKGKSAGYAVYKKNLSESTKESAVTFINEAAEFKIPRRVEDLMPTDELDKFKNIDNIKEVSYPKINLKRLDTIKYEANYILNKSKDPKSQEKNIDLLKVWELGIKNVNDYFQSVIDTNRVMSDVKGAVDDKTEKMVADNNEKIDKLQKLGITETVPAGTKFNVNKLYAFECVITGQNNKSQTQILMMSPTSEFVEEIDGKQYFWFKLLGGYDYNLKTNKIDRKNIFADLTQNKSIVNNFNDPNSAYYVVLTNLRANPNAFYFEVYSNKGRFFFNNKVVKDVDEVATEISTYKKPKFIETRKQIASISNFFKIKINQRFLVDDANVKAGKYPGIQMTDLTADIGIDIAKANHEKFMKLIK